MSVPVVVLNRDRRLDQLSLHRTANDVEDRLRVGLERNAKLDNLALNYRNSCASPASKFTRRKIPAHQRPPRKRRKLAVSFKPDFSGQITTLKKSTRTVDEVSDLVGDGNRDSKNVGKLRDGSKQDGSTQAARPTQPQSSSGQTMADPPKQGGSECSSTRSTSSSKTSKQEDLSKEDFMALLCLSPAHVVARLRNCTRHRASKYLHIKTRELWNKICRERNDPQYIEAAKRPSYIVLERNEFIDSLALQSITQSVHLRSLTKPADHRKHLCKRKPLSVVLERVPGLDRLALQNSGALCLSNSERNAARCEPILAGTVSLPSVIINHTLDSPVCKSLSVQINRDRSLDMLALKASDSGCVSLPSLSPGTSSCKTNNFSLVMDRPSLKKVSVKLMRDFCVDQLALQNNTSFTDSNSNCNNTAVQSHQPTLELSTDLPSVAEGCRKGIENPSRDRKGKLLLLPNFKAQNYSKIQESSRKSVIKLKRSPSRGWTVVSSHVELNRNGELAQPQSSIAIISGLSASGSPSSTVESTHTKNVTAKLPKNRVTSKIPFHTSREDDFGSNAWSRSLRSGASPSPLPNLLQRNPVFRSSERTCFKDVVSWAKSSRRAKSLPSESHRKHHNENENPQKPENILKTRGLAGKDPSVLQSDSFEETHSPSTGDRSRGNRRSKQPSISRYMSIKKPLRVTNNHTSS